MFPLSHVDGNLAAIVTNDGIVTLALSNLHGDTVATIDPTATTVTGYRETTEYGIPRDPASAADDYGWLGAKKRSTDDVDGLLLMGIRLYSPATGHFLSTDPIPGSNPNAYIYPLDPINDYDLTGESIGGWINKHKGAILTGISVAAGVAGLTPVCLGVCEAVAAYTGALASGANAVLEYKQHQFVGAALDTAGVATFGSTIFFQKVVKGLMPEYDGLVGQTGAKNARHKVGRPLGQAQGKLATAKKVDQKMFLASIGTMSVGQIFAAIHKHGRRR